MMVLTDALCTIIDHLGEDTLYMCEWVIPPISMFRENAVQSYLYLVIRSVSRFHLELLVLRVKKLSQTAAHLIYLSEAMPERLLNGHGKT